MKLSSSSSNGFLPVLMGNTNGTVKPIFDVSQNVIVPSLLMQNSIVGVIILHDVDN